MSTLATDDYIEFCEGFRRLAGLDLLQYKRGQMERRIRTFAERRGIRRLTDYLALLGSTSSEVDELLDRITINVSQLWRNPEQWELLRTVVVPALAEGGRIRAWSAGCSYGAEAYTLAALCLDAAPSARVTIQGTDIDPRIVERARAGGFSAEDARTAAPELLKRYFAEQADGTWQASPALRSLVTFEVGDLLRQSTPAESFDLVLCRNTVIYFTEEARASLHARLAASLRTGGYLVVGSTERVAGHAAIGLEPAHPFTYRKA